MNLKETIHLHHERAISLSDDLAAHPELPNEEFRSSRMIAEILSEAGYQVEYPLPGYPTGFRALLDCGDGPSVAILVEYDALPDLGHACGHNVHGSMSTLAALALADLKDQIQGKIYVFGTPAEEEAGAKVGMAEEGYFDDMSLAIMNHSWSGGITLPNMDVLGMRCYLIEFIGESAHAVAGPWKGHSALAAARKFLDLIDARRECFTPDIHVNAVFTDGGLQPSILPNRAELRMEFRTDSQGKLENVNDMVVKCAQGAAMALDCTVKFTKGYEDFADMVRVPILEEAVNEAVSALGQTFGPVLPPNGSSDVGNVSYHCPTIQPLFSICDPFYALHTVEFRNETVKPKAHQAIADGAEMIVSLILRILNDQDFRENVYASYLEQKQKKLEG